MDEVTALHAAAGFSSGELDYDLIDKAARLGTPETLQFDWKAAVPSDLAKIVASMANTEGGMIVIGVAESGHTGDPHAITPVDISDDARLKITSSLATAINPPLTGLRVDGFGKPGESTGFVVLSIPRSFDSPHFTGSPKAMGVPVRRGTRTDWLHEYEIANNYARRFNSLERIRERLEEHELQMRPALARERVWGIASVIPAIPAMTTRTVDRASVPRTMQSAVEIAGAMTITGEFATRLIEFSDEGLPVQTGLRRQILEGNWSNEIDDPSRNVRAELHNDGTFVLAENLHSHDVESGWPVSEVAVNRFARSIAAGAAAHARQQGVAGRAQLRVNLYCKDVVPSEYELWGPRILLDRDWGQEQRLRGTRRVERFIPIEMTIETTDQAAITDVAKTIARDVLSQFGLTRLLGFGGEPYARGMRS